MTLALTVLFTVNLYRKLQVRFSDRFFNHFCRRLATTSHFRLLASLILTALCSDRTLCPIAARN
jgi:hypothetical protein